MADLHYQHPKLVSVYDIGNGWSEDREFYLSLAGHQPKRVLDLGCGTGLLCNAYAERGHLVTGVDPAATMLDAAKRSKFGQTIEWVQATSQSFRHDNNFDLIIMTGHAFQVLLDDRDVLSTLSVVQKHLHKDGVFVFETRNPNIDWVSAWDGMHRELQTAHGPVRESFKVRSAQGDRIVFETEYTFVDEQLISASELRFMSSESISRHLTESRLRIQEVLGDWDGRLYDSQQSREMIFLVRHA